MKIIAINFKIIQTLQIEDFPLLKKHINERKSIETYLDYPDSLIYLVLQKEDEIIGVVGFELSYMEEKSYLYVSPLEIKEKFRNYGNGKLLMQKVIEFSKEFNLTGVNLMCEEEYTFFYSSLGFKIDHKKDDYFMMIYENY